MPRSHKVVSLCLPLLIACGAEAPPPSPPPPPPTMAATPPLGAPTPSASAGSAPVRAGPSQAPAPKPVAKYAGFQTPESVLYDDQADRYLVSNINGKPFDTDNNGFISTLSPDGQVTNLKWIEGGKNKVKLDAPKGLAIANGVLYAADITTVRMFDLKSGAPKGEVKISGSTFLNDLAAGPNGKVYVSDSGLKSGSGGFAPSGTDAVYVIVGGKAMAIAKTPELGGPNGLLVTDKGLVVVTFGSGLVYRLDASGKVADVSKPPTGQLDGVVAFGDSLLVSSWEGSAIYRGKLGGSFDEILLADQKAPADIGYDTKRGRLLVPHFNDDTVEVYELK
jgi:sugar lactone lactonase YvrE